MDIMRFSCYNSVERRQYYGKSIAGTHSTIPTELGYTQEDLADLCGVDASCISRWETGKWSPSAKNTLRLAQALKVSVEDLYDNGKSEIEDIATKQAVAEFKELKPKERGFVLTIIRELKKLRGEG